MAETETATIAPLPPPMDPEKHGPECGLHEELDADLAAKQGEVKVRVEKQIGRTIESFTQPDGTPVRYEQGGCHHFGITLTFGLAKHPDDLYAEALAQADRVAFVATSHTLADMLRAAGALSKQGYFSCGDSMPARASTCDVQVTERAGGIQLIVSLDSPL